MNATNRVVSHLARRALPAITALGALSLIIGSSAEHAAFDFVASPKLHDDVCEMTAEALQEATLLSARADYLVGAATCLNNPDEDFHRCLRELNHTLRDARRLAQRQYRERRQLCRLLGDGPYDPDIDPLDFSASVTNRLFPLVPGRTLIYESTGDVKEHIEVTTLREDRNIAGVPCAVVHDIVTVDGAPKEDTIDWYSQHRDGSVWYLGELAKNYDEGLLDNLDGSWRTDKNGAKPGILMLARPRVGDAYRQEFLLNEAEDIAVVVSLNNTVQVPAGTFAGCTETEESTPLEPGSKERKFYAPDVGFVLSVSLDTGIRVELIQIVNS